MKPKYYICESGEVRKKANAHRAAFIRLKSALFDVVNSLGAKQCRIETDMMLLSGIYFPNDPPAGWTKKGPRGSRPKPIKANADILKHFTPSTPYQVTTHPELQALWDWLKCPASYSWKMPGKEHSGWEMIDHRFSTHQACWLDANGPVVLILPNVAAAKAKALELGRAIEGSALDWTPPKGLREILPEEWDLMKARHQLAVAQRKKIDGEED